MLPLAKIFKGCGKLEDDFAWVPGSDEAQLPQKREVSGLDESHFGHWTGKAAPYH